MANSTRSPTKGNRKLTVMDGRAAGINLLGAFFVWRSEEPDMKTVTDQPREAAYLKAPAAARYLGISPRHLRQLAYDGAVPWAKVSPKCVLFRRRDLDQFVESRLVGEVRP